MGQKCHRLASQIQLSNALYSSREYLEWLYWWIWNVLILFQQISLETFASDWNVYQVYGLTLCLNHASFPIYIYRYIHKTQYLSDTHTYMRKLIIWSLNLQSQLISLWIIKIYYSVPWVIVIAKIWSLSQIQRPKNTNSIQIWKPNNINLI